MPSPFQVVARSHEICGKCDKAQANAETHAVITGSNGCSYGYREVDGTEHTVHVKYTDEALSEIRGG